MSRRSYDQPGCGLATALDLLGQRWTLLIVRELLVGPLRYTDLLARLSGIGTNLLAARLRHLEQIGVVSRHNLPPPAASAVYQLTDRGRQLEPILTKLAVWGQEFVDSQHSAGEHSGQAGLDPRREAFALHCAFQPERAQRIDDTYQFEIETTVLHAQVRQGRLQTGLGPIPQPKVTIRCDRLGWAALLRGWSSGADADARLAAVDVDGDERAARRALRIFGR